MRLETFFEKFDLLVDTTDAVEKMRELVLEWASAGKLVEQSSADDPAATLVEQIENHFAVMRSGGEMRGSQVEPLDSDNLPSIPSNWLWVRLGNVVDYGSSDKADSADIPEDAWLLDLEDIEKDTSRLLQRKTFRDSPSKSTKTAFHAGDVLYGKLRPYLNKVLIADAPGYCTTEIIPIRTFGFIDPGYLCYALKRPTFVAYATSKSYGMNLPRLGTEDARLAAFPLPPLAEQKRIVAKVDELMTLCDCLEAQLVERDTQHEALAGASLARFADGPTPANLELLFHKSFSIPSGEIRKSILTLAVQGKLVPQDPNDEPAIHELEQIEDEKRALIGVRKLRPNLVSEISQTRDLQYELPESWRWFRLGDVAFFQEGPGIRNWQFRTQGIKLLNVQNIVDGHLVLDNTNRYISADEFEATYRHFAVEPGDILFASSGASWGKTAWFVDPGYTVMLNTSMVRLKFYSQRCADAYLLLFLRTEFFKRQMEIQLVGIQPNFGSTHLGRVYIPIPPFAEQRRIVEKVDELMALVDALETQLATSRSTAEKLMEAVVAELTT